MERVVDVVTRQCARNGCLAVATSGVNASGKAEVCARHAAQGLVPVIARRNTCARDGCVEKPAQGASGGVKTGEFCAQHAAEGKSGVVVKRKKCAHEGCATLMPPELKGGSRKQAFFCTKHAARKGRVRLARRCAREGCSNTASFRVVRGKEPELCRLHAEKGMARVLKSRCARDGCSTYPTFGVKGSRMPEFCAKHVKDGMVDVVNKRCAGDGCHKHPSFGVEGSRKAEFCSQHAAPGMVNVVKRRCIGEGCYKQAMYGVDGTKTRVSLCTQHARKRGLAVDTDRSSGVPLTWESFRMAGDAALSRGSKRLLFSSTKRKDPPTSPAPLGTSSAGLDKVGGEAKRARNPATPTSRVVIAEEVSVAKPFMGLRRRRGVRRNVVGSTPVA